MRVGDTVTTGRPIGERPHRQTFEVAELWNGPLGLVAAGWLEPGRITAALAKHCSPAPVEFLGGLTPTIGA